MNPRLVPLLSDEEIAQGLAQGSSEAFRVLYDISKKQQRQFHFLFDDIIVPGKKRIFWDHFNRISEFSKHADRKPNDVLKDFNENLNDYLLFFCILGWSDNGKPLPQTMDAFYRWFITVHPNVLKDSAPFKEEAVKLMAKNMPRKAQLEVGRRLLAAKQ